MAALAASLLLLPASHTAARMIAVSVDEPRGSASLALIDVRPPWRVRQGVARIGSDAIVRGHGFRVYALGRSDGVLHVIDARTGRTLHRVELGRASAPEDLAVAGRRRVYVSRRGATHLLRVDPRTGETREVVDLSPLADRDGIPDLGTMALHGRRLFVQVRRFEGGPGGTFARPAQLAVVDVVRERLIDVDAERAGPQGIALDGTPPKFKMQVDRTAQLLFVGATGGFHDAGGIEVVDLRRLRSLGLLVSEESGRVGADVGAFVMLRPDLGYLTFSTDLLLSSHLVRFTAGGPVSGELHVTLDYFVPAILHDRASARIFLIDGGKTPPGAFAFDAASGAPLVREAIETGGVPRDAAFVSGRLPRATLATFATARD